MSWKTLSQKTDRYTMTMIGTEDEWQKRKEGLRENHKIISEGSQNYPYQYYDKKVRKYWARIQIQEEAAQ